MRRPCRPAAAALAAAVAGTALLGAVAPAAHAQPVPPPPPVITPDTSGCPARTAPPPPVDTSEVAAPDAAAPEPLPVPDEPVGGERMGECGAVLPAGAPPLPDGITATSWLVADLDTGAVLAAKDPHGRHRPASTIKLLTALVAVEQLPLDRVVTATRADAAVEGSSAGIGPGGRYTVRQLLAGLLLASGNDTAHALARVMGGVAPTLAAMNTRARALGATDTRAASPSGLDGPGMSTSAYDLALIFREVMQQPVLATLLQTEQVTFPGFGGRPGYVIGNDNRLLYNYPGALGGKTGFTDNARHTYVGAAERGGHRLVAVLLRAEQQPIPTWEQAAWLLQYGYALGSNAPVGRLVTGPPEPDTVTPTAEPTTTTTDVAADDVAAGPGPRPNAQPATSAIVGWAIAGTALLVGGLLGLALGLRRTHRT
ncbi:MAG: penicillin-binding protein [Pseudonocardiaceae bacterium]|nr:penicillin-binding protein [Pseudonocardiaceae bacterium]